MTTIEHKDLVDAVTASRDVIDPDLETELLEAIVGAEAEAAGDGATAIRSIDAVVTAAIGRGVGYQGEIGTETGDETDDETEEDEA